MSFPVAVLCSLVFAVVVVAAFSWRSRKSLAGIDIALANGALLLDVRTREEFAQEHLQGALNIPVQELQARLGELPDRDHPLVLVCRSGARTARAWWILRVAGYEQVLDLGAMRNARHLSGVELERDPGERATP